MSRNRGRGRTKPKGFVKISAAEHEEYLRYRERSEELAELVTELRDNVQSHLKYLDEELQVYEEDMGLLEENVTKIGDLLEYVDTGVEFVTPVSTYESDAIRPYRQASEYSVAGFSVAELNEHISRHRKPVKTTVEIEDVTDGNL